MMMNFRWLRVVAKGKTLNIIEESTQGFESVRDCVDDYDDNYFSKKDPPEPCLLLINIYNKNITEIM